MWLNFHALGLNGTINDEIDSLVGLRELFLHDNRLHGTLPKGFGALPALHTVRIYNNSLTGTPRFPGAAVVCDLVGADDNNCFDCPSAAFIHSTCQCDTDWVGCPNRPPPPPLITITTATRSADPTLPPSSTATQAVSGADPTGPIVGIVVGILLVLLAIGLGAWFVVRRKRGKPTMDVTTTPSRKNADYDVAPPLADDAEIPDVGTKNSINNYAKAPVPPQQQYDAVPPLSLTSSL